MRPTDRPPAIFSGRPSAAPEQLLGVHVPVLLRLSGVLFFCYFMLLLPRWSHQCECQLTTSAFSLSHTKVFFCESGAGLLFSSQ